MNRALKFFLPKLIIACLFLSAVLTVRAQYQIKSWTTDDGLPQNTVRSIVQTPDGYLWMTTLDGLARFDGVKFTGFSKQNTSGILSNRFNQLLFDSKTGDLWMATDESDVSRYRDGVFEHYEIAENEPKEPITNLVFDERGQLLALTATGVFAWNGEKFTASAAIGSEAKDKLALASKNGALWYVGKRTVPFIEPVINGGRLADYLSPDVENTDLGKYFTDSRGRLWIGTKSSGLLRIENGVLTVYDTRNGLPSNFCLPQIEDETGNLWATTDKGAVIIAPDGKVNTLTAENGLSDDSLTTITQDREGGIWIGTEFHGLNLVSRSAFAFFSKRDGLAENVVHPIFEDDGGDVWLGGRGLSVWRDNRFSEAFGRDEVLAKGATAIAQDRAGRLWFGNWGGTYYYENGKITDFSRQLGASQSVFAIRETADGALWFATNNGLFRRQNGATTQFTVADGLAGNDVKAIHESPDDTLWFGTYGGLSKYKDGVFASYTTADGLASNQIRSLYEDAGGALWIGSYDGGLTRLKDGKFTRYTTGDGLFNNGVFQILEDAAGNFWMSSNRGIYRVLKQQLNDFADGKINRIESIAYDKSDGLVETECNGGQQPAGIKARDGKLWFPTQGGVAVIDPEKIKTNSLAPPVVIETIKIDNEPVENNQTKIEIAPGKNNLEIAYTGVSFVKPEFVKFRYKLAGLDKDWVEAGNRRTAYYSYLPPGAYDFQVIAANSNGVWNTTGARVKIVVAPPFYRTYWF